MKNKQQCGIRFRRQVSIGRYVVDFYCPSAKLVIELDGESHESKESQKYDKIREDFIKELGLKVIRFKNKDVRENLTQVLDTIVYEATL